MALKGWLSKYRKTVFFLTAVTISIYFITEVLNECPCATRSGKFAKSAHMLPTDPELHQQITAHKLMVKQADSEEKKALTFKESRESEIKVNVTRSIIQDSSHNTTSKPYANKTTFLAGNDEFLKKVYKLRVSVPVDRSWFTNKTNLTENYKPRPMYNDSVILQPNKKDLSNWAGLLVLVPAMPDDFAVRDVIRKTWGSVAKTQAWPWERIYMEVNIVFLIGLGSEKNSKSLSGEFQLHGDIVQLNMVEAYRNLTRKVLGGLQWIDRNCPNVKFILKVDTDSFPDIALIAAFLKFRSQPLTIYGKMYTKGLVHRKGKWAIERSVVPYDSYVSYVSGPGYVLTRDTLRPLLEAAERTYILPFEDAFITGAAATLANVDVRNVKEFSTTQEKPPAICEFKQHSRLVGTGCPRNRILQIWKAITKDKIRHC